MHVRRYARHLLVASAMFPFVLAAQDAHLQIESGPSYMDGHAAAALFAEVVFGARRLGDSRWSIAPDVSLGWINGRNIPYFGNDPYTVTEEAWLLAAGARFQYHPADGRPSHWFVSFQPAYNTAHTQALSTPYEFVSTAGWQGRRFSFQLRHISNASLKGPNRGETMALVGVGFDL